MTADNIGQCHSCGHAFRFDPANVDTVTVNPATGRTLKPHENPEGAVKKPLCSQCGYLMNTYRVQLQRLFNKGVRK